MRFHEKRTFKINQASAKDNLTPFLAENKEICTSLQQYAREYLSSCAWGSYTKDGKRDLRYRV
jgi:hypothetical protein